MTEKLSGTVERKSAYGVMVKDEWYNVNKGDTSEWLDTVECGDTVVIDFEKNNFKGKTYRNVTDINVSTISPPDNSKPQTRENHAEGARIGMFTNNAAQHVTKMLIARMGNGLKEEIPPNVYAASVANHVVALKEEFDKRGLQ